MANDSDPQSIDSSDRARWVDLLSTAYVGGALPATFRVDVDHMVVELIVPYVAPSVARDTTGSHRIPLLIADGFPVPVVGRFRLPAYRAEEAASFVRGAVREMYLHELDEQLRISDRRPFAPEHGASE